MSHVEQERMKNRTYVAYTKWQNEFTGVACMSICPAGEFFSLHIRPLHSNTTSSSYFIFYLPRHVQCSFPVENVHKFIKRQWKNVAKGHAARDCLMSNFRKF